MKCLLVPIDFSDATPCVIDLAQELAKALDAGIHLIHVKELTPNAFGAGTLGYGLAGMPELAPMSGVPVPGLDPMPQPIRRDRRSEVEAGTVAKRNRSGGHQGHIARANRSGSGRNLRSSGRR